MPNANIIVAEQDGALIGFVTIDLKGYLDQLVVTPGYWGSDLGTALVDEANGYRPTASRFWSTPTMRAQSDSIGATDSLMRGVM